MAQAQRCREILAQLTKTPERASDEVHERLSLRQLVHEVIEPHAGVKDVRVEAIVTGAPGTTAPDIWRMPEIIHALTSFVENAVDFAAAEVLVTARFDAELRAGNPRQARRALRHDPAGRRGLAHRPHRDGPRFLHLEDAVGTNRGCCDVSEWPAARRRRLGALAAFPHRSGPRIVKLSGLEECGQPATG
jgi:two-component system, sensor histidine kinase RegB